ncbi:hypothetical protein BAE44_0000867, partial [Dichanthelium oligosanthes]
LKYEYCKSFLYQWDLVEGPWEMNKLHACIMRAMKKSLRVITARVANNAYISLLHHVVTDFEDLDGLYRQERLDMALLSMWCMQLPNIMS